MYGKASDRRRGLGESVGSDILQLFWFNST